MPNLDEDRPKVEAPKQDNLPEINYPVEEGLPKLHLKDQQMPITILRNDNFWIAAYVGFEPTSLCSNTNALPIELIGSTSVAINHIEGVKLNGSTQSNQKQ